MARKWFALTGIALLLASLLCAEEKAQNDYALPMMDGWRVKKAGSAKDLEGSFFKKDADDSAWEKAKINPEGHPPFSDKFIFYRRWVEAPAAWKGRKIEFSIGEAADKSTVYIDEQKVAEQKGRSRVCVDVTDKVQCGGKSLIAVMCENAASRGAGICGEVEVRLPEEAAKAKAAREAQTRAELKLSEIPYKIVYESYRDTRGAPPSAAPGNWELFMMNADGSHQVNLTNTPDVDEFYPHVSPDATKICFLADEKVGDKKVRNLYIMNVDGSGRTKIADNAREGCWSADGKKIAYLKGEFNKYTLTDYASKGLCIYDLTTQKTEEHPNKELHHLYNMTWTPDGNWFVATVHGGMGYKHAILAFEANGTKVFPLSKWKVGGCRPDLSCDGKHLAWGASDETLMIADIDFSGPEPKVTNVHPVAHCPKGFETYHIDWSPDMQHITFSYGPSAGEQIGTRAPGWNICVGDLTGKWAPVTMDGKDDKEPDWVPIPAGGR